MKKIYYSLFCLLAAVMVTACTHEEEDLFDSSSATRADAAVEANLAILTGSENGWLMEYFPEAKQSYGGYNILVKFGADGKVDAASELFESTDIKTSLYSVKQSAGVTLSFDTYNDIFHFFAEPGDPAAVGGNGYGLEGDYDFLILEATAEKILLKGKKSGSYAVLTPVQKKWDVFLNEIQKANAAMLFSQYTLKIGSEELAVLANYRTLVITVGDGQTVKVPYIVTATGFKFYDSVVIGEKALTGFTFDATQGDYGRFTAEGSPEIQLIPAVLPLNQQLIGGDWYFTYSRLGDALKPYFAEAYKGSAAEGEDIVYMFLGAGAGPYAFAFQSGKYTGYLTYNIKLTDEDLVTLEFGGNGDSNGVYYFSNCGYDNMIAAIAASAVTYKLTTDNKLNPSSITLTSVEDPNRVFTLVKQTAVVTRFPIEINYPFEN